MNPNWQPFREPLRSTLVRTVAIALILGAGLALWRGGLSRWPLASLLVFWYSFGGHWVEIAFLNGLRPHISPARVMQVAARVGMWFVGGVALGAGVVFTAKTLGGFPTAQQSAWWMGGLALIAVELVAHLPMQMRGQRCFYNGRG